MQCQWRQWCAVESRGLREAERNRISIRVDHVLLENFAPGVLLRIVCIKYFIPLFALDRWTKEIYILKLKLCSFPHAELSSSLKCGGFSRIGSFEFNQVLNHGPIGWLALGWSQPSSGCPYSISGRW